MDINYLWNEMAKLEGYTFYTTRDKAQFTIKKRSDEYFDVYRDDKKLRTIKKENMEFILNHPNEKWSVYRDNMYCSSYALVIYNAIINKK